MEILSPILPRRVGQPYLHSFEMRTLPAWAQKGLSRFRPSFPMPHLSLRQTQPKGQRLKRLGFPLCSVLWQIHTRDGVLVQALLLLCTSTTAAFRRNTYLFKEAMPPYCSLLHASESPTWHCSVHPLPISSSSFAFFLFLLAHTLIILSCSSLACVALRCEPCVGHMADDGF